MLSIKELVKVYKTKGGAEVRALDGVSVDFPDKGMVFLLGKSGSGKSTLLNVAGGLDRPDRGEVIVKGKSSKNFTAADFDSYRNTYVGFVFQEYNILDEFNVEQNIALALQLQGKKNDKDAVNALLEQVDLSGLGKRKPNTLSGGQKQRVAIARALIKEPEIIMADEPTGALDSNTGKQVFDTLKKLSADKLVIVVSHDREFAEQYADRIIELKDGKIISDTSKALAAPKALSANVNAIGADTVRVKDWNKLTQDDFNQIWSMMKGRNGEVIITSSDADMPAIKRVCKIADDGSKEYFKETDRSAVKLGQYDASRTKFIKSKMPLSRAVKMGASGLKTKPVRLFFTILLSVISFAMFGVLSTMMMYDPIYSVASALENSPYRTAMLSKQYNYRSRSYEINRNGEKKYGDWYDSYGRTMFGKSEVDDLNKNSENLKFAGVIGQEHSNSGDYSENLGPRSSGAYYYSVLNYGFSGFTDCGAEFLSQNNFRSLVENGKYPENADEMAISKYVYEGFEKYGYSNGGTVTKINTPSDMVGKKLKVMVGYKNMESKEFTVTDVYDTGSLDEYREYKDNDGGGDQEAQKARETFSDVMLTSFHGLGFVAPAFIDKYGDNFENYDYQNRGIEPNWIYGTRITSNVDDNKVDEYMQQPYYSTQKVKDNAGSFNIYSADGTVVSSSSLSLGEREAYASLNTMYDTASSLYYASSDKEVSLFIDETGETRELSKDDYRQTDGYYTNYAGDVSLTPEAGYAWCSLGNWISKTGEVSYDDPQYNGKWQTYYDSYYYKDAEGRLTDSTDIYVVENIGYYMDVQGDKWQDDTGNRTYVEEKCYYLNDNQTVYTDSNLPRDMFVRKTGTYYVMNDTGELRLTDPIEDWRHVEGYYLDIDGNIVTDEELKGYNAKRTGIYFNKNGDYSLFEKDGYDNFQEMYYIDNDGNVSIDPDWKDGKAWEQRCGFFVSAGGEFSLTKKPGFVFTRGYYQNETGDVKFVTRYTSFWQKNTDNVENEKMIFCPYNGWADQYRTYMKSYGQSAENADYADAFQRLNKKLGRYWELPNEDIGEFTGSDLALILTCISRDYENWCGRKPEVSQLYAKNARGETDTLQIKGYYFMNGVNGNSDAYILSDAFAKNFEVFPSGMSEWMWGGSEVETDYVKAADARYHFVVTNTENTLSQSHFMLDSRENGAFNYAMTNSVYKSANSMASMIDMLKLVFLIAGAVMAVLSALMLFNFISASISAKRKEIGVLRAVGARGTDVFKIFFAEAIIIALICFVLSAVAAGVVCAIMNGIFITSAVKFSVLNYGVIQILLILGIALVVSFIATILPVFFAAKKPPVESIRAL